MKSLVLLLFFLTPCFADAPSSAKPAAAPAQADIPKAADSSLPNGPALYPRNTAGDFNSGIKGSSASAPPIRELPGRGVNWGAVLRQSGFFLTLEQGFRVVTQPGTRDALKGPFFKDWIDAAKATKGWGDGDDFLTNYIGHPMQGSVTGFIFAQNDPGGHKQEFGRNSAYWKSRLRATAWSALYSAPFELGPISEASLGNVGVHGGSLSGVVDLVVTPTAGLGWQIGEDAIDKYLIMRIEGWTRNPVVLMLARSFLNPTRSFANAMRWKVPWNRDTRPGIWGQERD
jgi:hypothetical protein